MLPQQSLNIHFEIRMLSGSHSVGLTNNDKPIVTPSYLYGKPYTDMTAFYIETAPWSFFSTINAQTEQ